tara:strand:- start:218 stop:490 length:273 start_codon:yes stop_codon:yes gene_type:complete
MRHNQTNFPLIDCIDVIKFLFKNKIKKIEIMNHLKNTTTMGDISPVDSLPAIVFPAQPSIAKQSSSVPFFKKDEYNGVNTGQLTFANKIW